MACSVLIRIGTGLAIASLAIASGRADPIEDFYRGKQIMLVIRAAPGGNYDTYMRLLGRHLVRHIPGNPQAVPVNMPGAGGLVGLNHMVHVAPQDGTVMMMMSSTAPMDQALNINQQLKVDMRKLNWIGNMSAENQFVVTGPKSATKTYEDARQRVTTMAGSGAGGSEIILAAIMNKVLGTKFKNIAGYRSGPEMTLAMDRGETDGRWTTNLRALFASAPAGGSPGSARYNVILQVGMEKDKEFPASPLIRDLARDAEQKAVLDFISQVMALARPIAAAENVPPERVAALRQAFMATMKDQEFLDEAKRLDLEVTPMSGEALQSVIESLVNAPASVLDRIRDALATGAEDRGDSGAR
jgi:tripartite-type tricarboxylate transporter receptor subunit TctC